MPANGLWDLIRRLKGLIMLLNNTVDGRNYIKSVVDERMSVQHCGKSGSCQEKPVPVPLCPPQTAH